MEINFSLVEHGVGSFRVNIFRQRGACAMVIRHIKHNVPSIEELQLPSCSKSSSWKSAG
jgi:twitching motility protein PilU